MVAGAAARAERGGKGTGRVGSASAARRVFDPIRSLRGVLSNGSSAPSEDCTGLRSDPEYARRAPDRNEGFRIGPAEGSTEARRGSSHYTRAMTCSIAERPRSIAEIWPPYGLVVEAGDLRLLRSPALQDLYVQFPVQTS